MHVMMENYKDLKCGQRVTVLGHTRDSGYLVCEIDGTDSLPFENIVKTVKYVEEMLHYHECKVNDFKRVLREP